MKEKLRCNDGTKIFANFNLFIFLPASYPEVSQGSAGADLQLPEGERPTLIFIFIFLGNLNFKTVIKFVQKWSTLLSV